MLLINPYIVVPGSSPCVTNLTFDSPSLPTCWEMGTVQGANAATGSVDFDSGRLNLNQGTSGTLASEVGIKTVNPLDFTDKQFSCRIYPSTTNLVVKGLIVFADANNHIRLFLDWYNRLHWVRTNAGTIVEDDYLADFAVWSGGQRWVRLAHESSDDKWHLYVSEDGTTWNYGIDNNANKTWTRVITITSAKLGLFSYTADAGNVEEVYIDNAVTNATVT
jgi:hypothetical protein